MSIASAILRKTALGLLGLALAAGSALAAPPGFPPPPGYYHHHRPWGFYRPPPPPPYYLPPPVYARPPVVVVPPPAVGYLPPAHVQWCLGRYRSYNPSTNMYFGYDGRHHVCHSPFG